jgi:hypothetical protein
MLRNLLDPPKQEPSTRPVPHARSSEAWWDEQYEVVGEAQRNSDGSNRQDIIRRCKAGEPIHLRREPRNAHDRNAVAIYTNQGKQIGYLDRSDAVHVATWMDHGAVPEARIQGIYGGTRDKPYRGVVIEVGWPGEEWARRARETPTATLSLAPDNGSGGERRGRRRIR